MDVHCPVCGEPWDVYYLRHEGTREEFEAEGFVFGENVVDIRRCSACPKGEELDEKARARIKAQAVIAEMLGDDVDGLASELEMLNMFFD